MSRELEEKGWVRRFIANEPKLGETVEQYRSMGFEVLLEPVTEENIQGCSSCYLDNPEAYRIIYTRKP